MTAAPPILHDILAAVAGGAVADRRALLRHVTDLFIAGSNKHSDEDIALFDDVFIRLVVDIETSARALLAMRLASVRSAPPAIVRALAFDDDVDVAGPVLTQSERLDDPALIENAKSKSQEHLLAISRRSSISIAITDVLVERGDAEVLLSTVENQRAQFSEAGFARIVQRSEGDDRLATSVGRRPDLPRHVFTTLLEKASDHVRAKLVAEYPHAKAEISGIVGEIAARIADEHTAQRSGDMELHASLESMHRSGQLDDEQIRCFAEDGLVKQVEAALSVLSGLTAPFIQQALCQDNGETLLVIARANGLSWATVRAILQLPIGRRPKTPTDIRHCLGRFERLSRATAVEIVKFHKARVGGAAASP